MAFFDSLLFALLKDGKPKEFKELLAEVWFFHNTLRLHLARLLARGKDLDVAAGEPLGTVLLRTRILGDSRHLVKEVIPTVTDEAALEVLKRTRDHALSLGCTGVHYAGLDAFGMGF